MKNKRKGLPQPELLVDVKTMDPTMQTLISTSSDEHAPPPPPPPPHSQPQPQLQQPVGPPLAPNMMPMMAVPPFMVCHVCCISVSDPCSR